MNLYDWLQRPFSFVSNTLVHIPFVPINIHKLQLQTSTNEEHYSAQEEEPHHQNKAKLYEENIDKTITKYTAF